MKYLLACRRAGLGLVTFFSSLLPVLAITFTNDFQIQFNNTNYDGADIVVSNCTLTVDGAHSFANLQILSGAKLTHTFTTNGVIDRFTVAGEEHLLTSNNPVTLNYSNAIEQTIRITDASGLTVYTNTVDYAVTTVGSLTTIQRTDISGIPDGDTVRVDYEATNDPVQTGLTLNVAGDLLIEAGGSIDAKGRGYAGGAGPGKGSSSLTSNFTGSGAGHGGYGGLGSSNTSAGIVYETITAPVDKGSGGGAGYGGVGSPGGGAIKLEVGGTVTINGTITADAANATNNRAGGGSGGSVWIVAQTISGTGVISANGGAGEPPHGGGGAGGRIVVEYTTNNFSGSLSTFGGSGASWGGAGTVYTTETNGPASLRIDNGGHTATNTPLSALSTTDVIVRGRAMGIITNDQTMSSLLIESNSWLTFPAYPVASPSLTIQNNATIQSGGGITLDGLGYPAAQGTGLGATYISGTNYAGGGAGHGGFGGMGGNFASGGNGYGVVLGPATIGSGGGGRIASTNVGGAGGGYLLMTVKGTVALDGKISADGRWATGTNGGGGAGGSLWLSFGALTGSGTISANGGNGMLPNGGGAGGGRISMYSNTNNFVGLISAYGGTGSSTGGAGIITVRSGLETYGTLLLDNGGRIGTNSYAPGLVYPVKALIIQGGAKLLNGPAFITNVIVRSNSLLILSNSTVNVYRDVTIESGGAITADGTGYPANIGNGHGGYSANNLVYYGGGGGLGGWGGSGGNLTAYGGSPLGTATAPTIQGSGGGSTGTTNTGGTGGGYMRLTINGNLTVDGRLSANGTAAINSAGGGSGGSIYLTVQGRVAGTGIISANGGNGHSKNGGGGSGGRIALEYRTNNFAGAFTAYGGDGLNVGGAGTIYTVDLAQPYGTLLVDNGNQIGTNTSGTLPATIAELTVRRGAILPLSTTLTIQSNLLVSSNAFLILSNQVVTVQRNATLEAGGTITADGIGNPANIGTGRGGAYFNGTYYGGGGGYGGWGGSGGHPNAFGGAAQGSANVLTLLGNGGGSTGTTNIGGSGGGYIRLTVNGNFIIDGKLSANGNPAIAFAGGGSGGSVYLTVQGRVSGSGTISVNGGSGHLLYGGGGGGGRIALEYRTNNFTGLMTAYGGSGVNIGGAGTIYTYNLFDPYGNLLLDNNDQLGTNSSSTFPSTLNTLTIRRGAGFTLGNSFTIQSNLVLASNCWMIFSNTTASVLVRRDATIETGALVTADRFGYAAGQGTGLGKNYYDGSYHGGGGGHGGVGGAGGNPLASGGISFGNITAPGSFGSGGGGLTSTNLGGPGGGVITFTVNGALSLQGRMSADGGSAVAPNGGGGAGGSISLTVGSISGSGSISANGGNGLAPNGGGGGGGRIALNYGTNLFGGTITAFGGTGTNAGGAGTIYLKPTLSQGVGSLLIDNGNRFGAETPLTQSPATYSVVNITRGGVLSNFLNFTAGNLLIGSNSWLRIYQPVTVTGNATIQAGGGVEANGLGAAGNTGSGRGFASGSYNGGGGYGGKGGNGSVLATGGGTYDNPTAPFSGGSGGAGTVTGAVGGSGGGNIRLTVNGQLILDGQIAANGRNGSGQGGGGSGGGIWLTLGTFSGNGSVLANGGSADPVYGGGGGGGRVAVTYATNLFIGTLGAFGGNGVNRGGGGTVYLKANSESSGRVIIDNNGLPGALTTIGTWSSSSDLIIQGGAAVSALGSLTMRNLIVESNGWLQASNTLTVTEDAWIKAGGGIVADGTGSNPASGSGAGFPSGSMRGGGGHGGYGGANPSFAGLTYDPVESPFGFGSGGANGSGSSSPPYGGNGGGRIRVTVGRTFTNDGKISANGFDGDSNAGGGSGGSVWINTTTFAGSGSVSANGGAGNTFGGGGGGGRVALYFNTNTFAGPITARGGTGYVAGGAGTVYLKTNSATSGRLIVENGGVVGTNTPLATLIIPCDLTLGNGAVAHPQSSPLTLRSLFIDADGFLTCLASKPAIEIDVLRDTTIAAGGTFGVDGKGFSRTNGAGAGASLFSEGSGAGYGGAGGASHSGATGGVTYGLEQQPVDIGSGGGSGFGPFFGGSEGGGAIRLVTATLNVDGRLSANGKAGLQDNSGGGSGGSIWITTGTIFGNGVISANGGAGELFNGGGGGGGRIAIYSPSNNFNGLVTTSGGEGASWGDNGTIYYSTNLPLPAVISQTPAGLAGSSMSSIDFVFNTPLDPDSVANINVVLYLPDEPLDQTNMTVSLIYPATLRASFPLQTRPGNYTVSVGPNISDLFGQTMAAAYSGAIRLVAPMIRGAITDTNGQPVVGVVIQPSGGLPSVTTDTNGNYGCEVIYGWNGTLTPALSGFVFGPGMLSYTDVTGAISNQNFLALTDFVPVMSAQRQGTNTALMWNGFSGITYQPEYSTNLVNWMPFGNPLSGTNGPLQLLLPVDADPAKFFRLRANN